MANNTRYAKPGDIFKSYDGHVYLVLDCTERSLYVINLLTETSRWIERGGREYRLLAKHAQYLTSGYIR